jgi:hypothetical protein
VNLVDDHGLQASEHRRRVGQREQQREALRRGEQQVWRLVLLALAFGWRGVAGAGFDADRQAHVFHRPNEVARDVGGQRLQRADVQGVQAITRHLRQRQQGGQEPGERLAAAGWGDEQDGFTGPRGVEHGALMAAQRPAARGEPGCKGFRQCSAHPA